MSRGSACGSRSNAFTARNLSSSAGPTRKAGDRISARCCSPITIPTAGFLTWTEDNLLRQVVYEGLREDKPAAEVRRPAPHRQAGSPG
jgi:hypothetical protein